MVRTGHRLWISVLDRFHKWHVPGHLVLTQPSFIGAWAPSVRRTRQDTVFANNGFKVLCIIPYIEAVVYRNLLSKKQPQCVMP